MITLYDFPTSLPGKSISPYTWRVRLALNLKGIEHKTEWIQYCDLETRLKELDIPPSEIRSDGTPAYTIPAIFDSTTNARISDSLKILEYLDKTYPDTPQLFVPGTEVLTAAFAWAARQNLRRPIWPLTVPKVTSGLEEKSSQKYKGVFESRAKMNLEEFKKNADMLDKLWKDAEEGYNTANDWFKAAKGPEGHAVGPWITGKDIRLADVLLAADFAWPVAVFGEDSEEWKRIGGWKGGRWREYFGLFKQYTTVH